MNENENGSDLRNVEKKKNRIVGTKQNQERMGCWDASENVEQKTRDLW